MTGSDDVRPLIALISATQAAIGPAVGGLAREFGAAVPWNIVDDRLLDEATASGGLTPSLTRRMSRLIEHALAEGAAGVLLTCSLYGPVTRAYADKKVPVLAADDAAFTAALTGGYRRILVLASMPASLRDTSARLAESAASAGVPLELTGAVADGAFAAAARGDGGGLAEALAAALPSVRPSVRPSGGPSAGGFDAVLLAQYSLAPAAADLARRAGVAVLSGPDLSAALLRARVEAGVRP
jgi:hypothetical protein